MKIAIDLDGVVFDSERIYFERSSKCEEEYKTGVRDELSFRLQDRFNWSEKQIKDFMNKNIVDVCSCAPFMCGAKESILKLKKLGHEVVFITSRGGFVLEEQQITKRLLKEHKLDNIPLYFTFGNKLCECRELDVDLLIDDYYKNVECVSGGGINCIYFNTLTKKHFPKSNTLVHEVSSWQEVMAYFE